MGWGRRAAGDERARDALLKIAALEMSSLSSKTPDRLLAGLYAEQCRTNDLLEQLLMERSAAAQ